MPVTKAEYEAAKARQSTAEAAYGDAVGKQHKAKGRGGCAPPPPPVHELSEADVAAIREYEAEEDRKMREPTKRTV